MSGAQEQELARRALRARENAHAPYSDFAVGAALLTDSGSIYTGCNIENASYPAGNCAERTAIFKAVSEGERDFTAIAIAGGKAGEEPADFCPPCGICRQVMAEFFTADTPILLIKSEREIKRRTLGELLPEAFHQRH
jgi:cytidine deaminase